MLDQKQQRQSNSALSNVLRQSDQNARTGGVEWNRDLHTSNDDTQFGHLLGAEEEQKRGANQDSMAFQAVPNSPTDSEDDSGSDSDAGPSRWQQPSSLEMDCIFLEDESTKEENTLPQIFDLDSVHQLDSRFCMLCSETFGRIRMIFKHNCKRCGKAVCENCSKQSRRLCQIDPKKHRVCDECDALMANHLLEKMFEREAQQKKQNYEDLRAQRKDATVMREQAQLQLEQAKQTWEDKTKETDKKIKIREAQITKKIEQGDSLREEIAKLQKMLEEVDGKVQAQEEDHQKILNEMTQMEEQMQDVGEKLRLHESMINEKKGMLVDRATDAHFKSSLLIDQVDVVDYVDRKDWRPQGGVGSDDSDDDDSEYSESQPAQSLEQGNPLNQR